ncbi:DNA mismatch repair protein MutS [Polymorphobacter multimanifer]|uniref:DNA mismatch repair protein MutS n=2 Tax=Polymorphobacter multimanifer TaxID=1070431 RepID=A0A841L9J8_9SPHN|nr:DNA mismatch repair protein MutS [Polymorphobacter multimanifer]MBB6226515.1 DNA mismatch repair protein MutS [Polymorphobacter multimanifer]
MIAQYLALKAQSEGCLLFFRMGDFYELFFEDAQAAARTLDITLTSRGEHAGAPIPMCGVPIHAADGYLARLIKGGHRVAIAEQIESPAEARKRPGKSLVARAITRIVTPGTLTEDVLLEARRANWLAAVTDGAIAWLDLSTGSFHTRADTPAALAAELARLAAAETLHAEGSPAPAAGATARPASDFGAARGEAALKGHFGVTTLDGFGAFTPPELAAAGALLAYVKATALAAVPLLCPPRRELPGSTMAIDAATRASLELARSSRGSRSGSLEAVVDATVTAAGARALGEDLAAPLTDPAAINARLDLVEWFASHPTARPRTRQRLAAAPDIARALGRLAIGRWTPRDLAAVRDGVSAALALKAQLAAEPLAPALLGEVLAAIGAHGALLAELSAALVPQPPVEAAGSIASGFDAALDALKASARDGRSAVAALESRLRAETGVASLKVRHNGVLGYHIEVPARAADPLMVPTSGFIHRQTLAGQVRFGSVELAGLAASIASAADHAAAAEAAHLEALREAVLAESAGLGGTAQALARLDVASALAERAAAEGWVRPLVDGSTAFAVRGGRHPVVEAAVQAARGRFVANDCDLSADARLWLVTGPNMAGKSTFLRQNALIAVMAQAGSFVPAAAAHIGIVDRLFSRVGASDDLAQGRSTFMVEMVETAAILSGATARSLVILDEVGRGTSTYDGLAIAWAVLEAVHDDLQARCLFATHYRELTALAARLKCLACVHVRAREWKGELVFLHEVVPGAADRSYGLAVARLAGVPAPVLARARSVLARLEANRDKTGGLAAGLAELPLFAAAAPVAGDALRERLAGLDVDEISPREALDLLAELKAMG